jgi:hypothetical protein
MIVITPDVIANVYNWLIKRPFDEVAAILLPLHNEVDAQFKALAEKAALEQAPVAPSDAVDPNAPIDVVATPVAPAVSPTTDTTVTA